MQRATTARPATRASQIGTVLGAGLLVPARGRSARYAATAVAILLLAVALPLRAADGDGDGLDDAWEAAYFGNLAQGAAGDPDGDGLTNAEEKGLGTDPTHKDSDGDGLTDGEEAKNPDKFFASSPTSLDTDGDFLSDFSEVTKFKTSPTKVDSDGDGLPDNVELQVTKTNPLAVDTDNGFSDDGAEVLIDGTDPTKPDDDKKDSDGDGLADWQELNVHKTNRFAKDTDEDGLEDGEELDEYKTKPTMADTDADGLKDGFEVLLHKTDPLKPDSDGDGLLDGVEVNQYGTEPLRADSDWDSLKDGQEVNTLGTNPLKPDSDGGGLLDPVEVFDGLDPKNPADDKGKDKDGDSLSDNFEAKSSKTPPTDADADGDGLSDAQEFFALIDHLVTHPLDADTDDDGVLDGKEGGISSDGNAGNVFNGGTSPLLFDTDGDGLGDALEQGLTAPQISAKDPKATKGVFKGDSDPATTTDVLHPDTDLDGLPDGKEDANGNGKWDAQLGETDPAKLDTDGDGLDDGWEVQYAVAQGEGPPLKPLDPADGTADNDGDGLSNQAEYGVKKLDKDGKLVPNRTNPRKKDSDGDGLPDKVEVEGKHGGPSPLVQGTDPNDTDTDDDGLIDSLEDKNKNGLYEATESSPKKADTDGDNLPDGVEDASKNGVWDKAKGETDPANPDSDGDGVNDGLEVNFYGTNPNVVDTDADGLPDGLEVGKKGDLDPKSTTNPKATDTDGDGLADNLEDANLSGKVDGGETNPVLADTDGDGLADGLEAGKAGDADPGSKTSPLLKDTDGDGLLDSTEDKNKNGKQDGKESDPTKPDTDGGGSPDGQEVVVDGTDPLDPKDDQAGDNDGDGLKNLLEKQIGTDPGKPDTDGDGLSDLQETAFGKGVDTDGDGTIDALDLDSDADIWPDAEEAGDGDLKTPPVDSDGDGTADFRSEDSDGDGLEDAKEKIHATDRTKPDTDNDGLQDGQEVAAGLSPIDRDSDDDALLDGEEPLTDGDGDGLVAGADADSDNDGLFDGTEAGRTFADPDTDMDARAFIPDLQPDKATNPHHPDSDGDGVRDGAEDPDHDGVVSSGESDPALASSVVKLPDTDGDGLPDEEESNLGSDPKDTDSDDDGVPDSNEWNFACDTDRDGATNVADADSDDDGLPDGLERGAGVAGQATWRLARNFLPDGDLKTSTSPLRPDTDFDGARDGLEDVNQNGTVDPGEGDPNDAASQGVVVDGDGDGLSNFEELRAGSNPADRDSDDDGLPDGLEPNATFDTDGDGLPSVLDPDSDDDGLADGTERGVTQPVAATAGGLGTAEGSPRFRPDQQPTSKTRALARDSDRDGQPDGWEDHDHDGGVDQLEGDANDPEVVSPQPDSDADGLCDGEEKLLGTKPTDADSDDDGVPDGHEDNYAFDLDEDGFIPPLDEDADGDGGFDGTERGLVEATLPFPKHTDLGSSTFRPDADPGSRTFAAVVDSDRGGRKDGEEDFDHDGQIDLGESDPTVPDDDAEYDADLDGDGLENALETEIGTNPQNADTDGDGMYDATEVTDPVHPYDSDGDGTIDALDGDSDADQVPDSFESGFDPAAPPPPPQAPLDSDKDGLADYRDKDADDDGLLDGEEVGTWHTDPRSKDTDGGGLDDRVEVQETRTNPLDPADDVAVIEYGAKVRGTTVLSACGAGRTPGSVGLAVLLVAAVLGLRAARRRKSAWLLASCLLLAPAVALGLTPPDVTGGRFNLDGQGLLGVDAARQQELWKPSLGAQFQYAWRPLVVGTETEVRRELVGTRLQADVGASVRMVEGLTLGFVLPLGVYQTGSQPSLFGPESGRIEEAGLGDLVLAGKYVFKPDRADGWGFAAVLPVTLPTGDEKAYLGRPGPTVQPTAVASTQVGPWRVAFNLGARIQSKNTLFNITDGPVLRTAVAGSLNPAVARTSWKSRWVPDGWWVDASLTHETPLDEPFSNRENERLEAGLGLSFPVGDALFATLGSTFGMWPGFGVPAVRPMLLIRYGEPGSLVAEVKPPPRKPIAQAPADRDGDRIVDASDKCPDAPEDADGFEDGDGCPEPDNDQDSLADADDKCRDLAEDMDGYADTDGCPDEDDDGDGVVDLADRCPRVAEDADGREDGDGCPDLDDDADGIADADDRCPTVAENFDGHEDGDGCPDQRLARLDQRAGAIVIGETVRFATRQARILRASKKLLDQVAAILLEHPEIGRVEVAGHTDERGTDEMNQALSQARAEAVVHELVRRGVQASRLVAVGYGKSRPKASGSHSGALAVNRRVEFRLGVQVGGPDSSPKTPPQGAPKP